MFLCIAKDSLEPPRKLPLVLSAETKDPLEDFFDIMGLGLMGDITFLCDDLSKSSA